MLVLAGAIVIGLALGVGIDVAREGGPAAWLAERGRGPAAVPIVPYVAAGRSIDLGGRAVYLDCRGAGTPTVVLEGGFFSGAGGWSSVLDGVAAFTRVCAWDRPGIGRSEGRGRHSAGKSAQDLRAALRLAGESGPYLVVAHSFGGVYGRLFAAAGPSPATVPTPADAVVGFVMLDIYEPDLGVDLDRGLEPDQRAMVRRNLDETAAMLASGEDLDWPRTMAELEAAGTVDQPTLLLMLDPYLRYGDPDPARVEALVAAWKAGLARRYPNGVVEIATNTGHVIQYDNPSLVIERVRQAVQRYRSS